MRRGILFEDNKKEFRESLESCEAGCTMGGGDVAGHYIRTSGY